MIFTEWLTIEMDKRGWNQSDLASETGLTKGALSHIFSGTRQPGLKLLTAIARALRLPTTDVFRAAGLLEAEPEKTPSLDEWIKIYVDADPETRELMLDNARFYAEREIRKSKA